MNVASTTVHSGVGLFLVAMSSGSALEVGPLCSYELKPSLERPHMVCFAEVLMPRWYNEGSELVLEIKFLNIVSAV